MAPFSFRQNLSPIVAALVVGLALMGWTSCGLEQEIELELPPYEAQPALEMYLSPGEPYRALLTTSSGFFDPLEIDNDEFLQNLLLDSAEVSVRVGDERVDLVNFEAFDPRFGQAFNYVSLEVVPANYTDSFYLEVQLPNGREITAATKLFAPVPSDSVVVEYPEGLTTGGDTLARILTYLTDPDPAAINRYYRVLTYSPVDSSVLADFTFSDEFNDQPSLPIATIFFFEPGDTVFAFTAHIDAPLEEYINSVQLAEASNGNPFAQPTPLLGNLRGDADALGVFAPFGYVVDTVVVGAP